MSYKKAYNYVEPRIRMEALKNRQFLVILAVTYVSVFIALISGFWEIHFATLRSDQSGKPCQNVLPLDNSTISLQPVLDLERNISNSNFSSTPLETIPVHSTDELIPCTIEHASWQQWSGYLRNWTILYGAFDLFVSVEPIVRPSDDFPANRDISYSVDVYGERNNSYQLIRVISNTTQKLRCIRIDNQVSCNRVSLLQRSDISCFACRDQLLDFTGFKVTLNYGSSPLESSLLAYNATVTYSFVYSRFSYKTVEISARFLMCISTFILTIYYVQQLHASGVMYNDFLPERKYILGILLTTMFYQNPLHSLIILIGSNGLHFAGKIVTTVAFSFLLTFYLFFLDCLRSIPGEKRGWDSYILKIIFLVIFLFIGIFAEVLKLLTYDSNYERLDRQSYFLSFVVYLAYAKMTLLVVWLIWIIVTIFLTRHRLRSLPYVSYRYRQLPFRFFILQGWCVLSFLFCTIFYNIWQSTLLDFDSGQDLLGLVLAISVYNYILGYLYLPVHPVSCCTWKRPSYSPLHTNSMQLDQIKEYDRAKRNNSDQYCAVIARWLLDFSIQCYYDPKGHATESGWGPMNESIQVLDFISDIEQDVHCLLAIQRDKLIVAFRGSSSKKHLWTNIDFFPTRLSNINKTVITRNVFIGVHGGFWRAYEGLRGRVIAKVGEYLQTPVGKNCIVFCTGHSLGGALATFASYELASTYGLTDLQMYNYGSPRVGDFFFALDYDALVPASFRIGLYGDFVTRVPTNWMTFRHIGNEIVADLYGNIVINPPLVERWFRSRESINFLKLHSCSSYLQATINNLNMILEFAGIDVSCPADLQELRPVVFFTDEELCSLFLLDDEVEDVHDDVLLASLKSSRLNRRVSDLGLGDIELESLKPKSRHDLTKIHEDWQMDYDSDPDEEESFLHPSSSSSNRSSPTSKRRSASRRHSYSKIRTSILKNMKSQESIISPLESDEDVEAELTNYFDRP